MASRVSDTEPIWFSLMRMALPAPSWTLGQTLGVGDEQVVAHQLDLAAQLAGHLLPAFPVLFIQTVLDGDEGCLL